MKTPNKITVAHQIKNLLQEIEDLKTKVKKLETEKVSLALQIADLNKAPKNIWPKQDPLKIGGYHLCQKCGNMVMNGSKCPCNFWNDSYKKSYPYPPQNPIYCKSKLF